MSFFGNLLSNLGSSFLNFNDPLNLTGVLGSHGSRDTILSDVWDKFKNGNVNDVNKEIADQNLQFQRENLDYQKAIQQQIFEREDTAYARTVSDMRSAGLNPLSMNGTNGAGEVVATNALNNGFSQSDSGNLQALSTIFNVINQANSMSNNTLLSNAQANFINAQADNQKIKNTYESDLLFETLDDLRKRNKKSSYELDDILLNRKFNEFYGLSENMPDFLKAAIISSNSDKNNHGMHYNLDNLSNISLDKSALNGAINSSNIVNALLSFIPSPFKNAFSGAKSFFGF